MYANIPAPLPDEFLRSYGFRIGLMNSTHIAQQDKLLSRLVEITGLSISYFIYHHTSLGYQRFVSGELFQRDIGTHPDLLTNNRIYGGALSIELPQFCASCVQEDMDFHGVSYWRRVHQLPGVDHCTKHARSLVAAKRWCMNGRAPLNAVVVNESIPERERDHYFSNPYIQRYSVLSDLAMHTRVPLCPSVITRTLVFKANALLGDERGVLTKFALEKLPPAWLMRHFPLIFTKPEDARFAAIDEVLRSSRNAYATKLYLLAMALLWDDPDDAMRACQQEARANVSGFHESGGEMALKDVLSGQSITKSCRRHGVQLRDFEYALQRFLKNIRPLSTLIDQE